MCVSLFKRSVKGIGGQKSQPAGKSMNDGRTLWKRPEEKAVLDATRLSLEITPTRYVRRAQLSRGCGGGVVFFFFFAVCPLSACCRGILPGASQPWLAVTDGASSG